MDSRKESGWGREFIAGGLGGMAGVMSGHPLDTIRIRQQQPRHAFSSSAATSALGLVRNMVKTEGAHSLYKGMSTPLASVAFQNAVAFQTYATLSRLLSSNRTEPGLPPSYASVGVAGFGTGALQTLILTPVELVKIRLQIQRSLKGCQTANGPLLVAQRIVEKEGYRGLYRGLPVTFIRDAPAHAVYFSSYEFLREVIHPGCRKNGGESLFTMLTAGGFAGALSWMVCYPVDVVKTRLQSQGPENTRYKGIVDCVRRSVSEEGTGVLWRGLGTALARAYVVNGAIFSAYEMSLRFLASRAPSKKKNVLLNNAIKSEESFLKGAEEATLP